MQEIFGIDTDRIMLGVAIGFVLIVGAVGLLALFNRVILKVGIRNIPRRPAQTTLIVVGLMLSTLIISSALGTGDTMNHSIRNAVIKGLGEIDEILTANLTEDVGVTGLTGSSPYFPISTFDDLRTRLSGYDKIDGLAPTIAERAPIANLPANESVGRMNIAAVDASDLGVFGPVLDVDGREMDLSALTENDVVINQKAAEELEAAAGASLTMFLQDGPVELNVVGVAADGGAAGDDETALMSLAQAQEFFGHPGEINSILVSNRGGEQSGADLSDEVTEHLRSMLTDRETAEELKRLLSRPEVVTAIGGLAENQQESMKEDLIETAELLQADGLDDKLVSHLADDGIGGLVLVAFESETDDPETLLTAFTLFSELRVLTVQDVKSDLLDVANVVASGIMSIFVIFGLFSIMAGVMLIFLIFVMLAAERKPEMGIARAIGMRRRHLVQSFIYEGMAYDLISAFVGASLGIAVGFAMVSIMAGIFASESDDFELVVNYRWQSFVISYCLGVVLTFITVFFSSYRASRLNIVAAIRDLPDTLVPAPEESRTRILVRAVAAPILILIDAFRALRRLRFGAFVRSLILAIIAALPPVWAARVLWALVRISSGALSKGWLTFLLGSALAALGLVPKEGAQPWIEPLAHQAAPFTIGVTVAVIGVGLMGRWLFGGVSWNTGRQNTLTGAAILLVVAFWLGVGIANDQPLTIALAAIVGAFEVLRQVALRRETAATDLESRNSYTFIGLTLILFWGTPLDSLEWIVPELNSNIEMFFVSGVCLVMASVWVIVYNADLITDAVTAVFGRFSKLRPSLKTAVAYPLNSRLRTGLTLSMLALVIFTLIVMSMLNTAFSTAFEDTDPVTGGWDIVSVVSYNNPIDDIQAQLPSALGGDTSRIAAVGGYTSMAVDARQPGAENQEWRSYRVRGAEEAFLENTGHDFKIIADGFGETKEEVWQAVRDNPDLAVIDAFAVPSRGGGGFNIGGPEFRLEGLYFEDEEMEPIEIEFREPRSGAVSTVTIVAVMDAVADQSGVIMLSKAVLDGVSEEPLPITTYRFRLEDGADAHAIAEGLDSGFVENGLESTVLADDIEEERRQGVAINRLLQGFMASGLLVGIAALGVISLRSVVERRQQIGVLRAIGYRQSTVLTSFLMESSFIALLGILLGVGLGALLSYNLVESIAESFPGLEFTIPWAQIGTIVAIAYAFSLLTTYFPARQASRIYPAQALRYE